MFSIKRNTLLAPGLTEDDEFCDFLDESGVTALQTLPEKFATRGMQLLITAKQQPSGSSPTYNVEFIHAVGGVPEGIERLKEKRRRK